MNRGHKYFLFLRNFVVMLFLVIIIGNSGFCLDFLSSSRSIIRIDSLPSIVDVSSPNQCDILLPKGILSNWYYDSNANGKLDGVEDLFYNTYGRYRGYGNTIFLQYDYNRRFKWMMHRCTKWKIINKTNNELWYSLNTTDYDLVIGYRMDKALDYISKVIILHTHNPMYVYKFGDSFTFPYYGYSNARKSMTAFRYLTFNNVSKNIYNYFFQYGGRSFSFPIYNTNVFLNMTNNRIFYTTLCKISKKYDAGSYGVLNVPSLSSNGHLFVFSLNNYLLERTFLDEDKVVYAKIIYYYGKNEIDIRKIVSKEGCNADYKGESENIKNKLILNPSISLYDYFSLEGITFAHALNLTYAYTRTPIGIYYYLQGTDRPTYNSIMITKEDIIKLAHKYNIPIYSSCDNVQDELLVGSIAYYKRGIYIPNYKNADIYLCGEDALTSYFREFNRSVYGISIIPKNLEWKDVAILYANKSYPFIVEDVPTRKDILTIIRRIFPYISSNMYFRRYGLFLILFGDRDLLPPLNGSDLNYGDIKKGGFIDLSVGRIPYPVFPKDTFVVKRAVLMSDYESPGESAFLTRFNGMFSSLIAKKWLSREGVNVKRYVERRANLSLLSGDSKNVIEDVKKVLPLILSRSSVSASSVLGLMYAMYSFSIDVGEIIHEIDITKSVMSDPSKLVFEENLTKKAFQYLKGSNFFGYFGRIRKLNFLYPHVSFNELPSFKGMFYLDYDNTYALGRALFEKGSFGIVLDREKENRKAQERIGDFMRFLVSYHEPIGESLKDSANIILSESSLFKKFGLNVGNKEVYGRVLLGDPSLLILMPKYEHVSLDNKRVYAIESSYKKDSPIFSSSQYFSKSYNIKSKSTNDRILDKRIVFSRHYNFSKEYIYINFTSPQDMLYVDVVHIPYSHDIKLSYDLVKEGINLSENISLDEIMPCQVFYNKTLSLNGVMRIYIMIPLVCKMHDKVYFVNVSDVKIFYFPDVEILNASYNAGSLGINVFSSTSRKFMLTLFDSNGRIIYRKEINLSKGVHDYKVPIYLSSQDYTLTMGNSTYDLNLSSLPEFYITEVYPNPPDNDLEFVEIYYKGKNRTIPISFYENAWHNITLNLSEGYYLLCRNKSFIMKEFDIPANEESRIMECRSLRLNNKGENLLLYAKGMLVDNKTYTSTKCIRDKMCSIHFNPYREGEPTPLYEKDSDLNLSDSKEEVNDSLSLRLQTSKVFVPGEVKVKIKKDFCDDDEVFLSYSLGNNKGMKELRFYCSKTIYIPVFNTTLSRDILHLSVIYKNKTKAYDFPIILYHKTTLPCNLFINIVPYTNYIDKGDIMYYDIIIRDLRCRGITHPVMIHYGIRDKNGRILYEYTTLKDMACSLEMRKHLKFSDSIVSKISNPLLNIFAQIKDPFCNSSDNLSTKGYVVYIGDIEDKQSESKNTMNKNAHGTLSHTQSKSLSLGRATFSTYNTYDGDGKKVKNISLDAILVNNNLFSLLINNSEGGNVTLYSYIVDKDNHLLTYYCNGSIIRKGWKANMITTMNNVIRLTMCLKNISLSYVKGNLFLKIKYSFNGNRYYTISKAVPKEILSRIFSYAYIQKDVIKSKKYFQSGNKSYDYECKYFGDAIGIEILPYKKVNITWYTHNSNVTYFLYKRHLYVLRGDERLYVNNKMINCTYSTFYNKRERNDKGVLNRIIEKLENFLSFLFSSI